jgi:hypothetical protein
MIKTDTDNSENSVFVIIDGYSTGSELVDELTGLDFSCIHIITPSTVNIAELHHFNCPSNNPNYQSEIIWDGNFSNLLSHLKQWNIINIVCCLEGDGVELREQLAVALNLPHNDIGHLNARRDKFYMAECLEQAGLPHLKQVIVSSAPEAVENVSKLGGFPLVVKPRNSGNSNGFHICHTILQLEAACNELLGTRNLLNQINDTVLLQEFLSGKEYALNTVSYKGTHYFTDAWSYDNNFEKGFRICESCSLEKNISTDLITYVSSCLDALGIQFGASHTELVLRSAGPIMIESAARLMGGLSNQMMRQGLSKTQLDTLVISLVSPDHLKSLSFDTKASIKLVNIVFRKKEGVVKKIPVWSVVTALASYRNHDIFVKQGDKVVETKEGAACIARIFLANQDEQQLNADMKKVLALEETLFIIN